MYTRHGLSEKGKRKKEKTLLSYFKVEHAQHNNHVDHAFGVHQLADTNSTWSKHCG